MSPGDNRFPSGEGTDFSETLAFSQSEQYWSVTGAQGALAAHLYSSEEWTEFVAVDKEPRDLGLPAAVEILVWLFPFPVVFFLLSFPLKFCFVYTHPLDSFSSCKQRNIADKPYLIHTTRFPVFYTRGSLRQCLSVDTPRKWTGLFYFISSAWQIDVRRQSFSSLCLCVWFSVWLGYLAAVLLCILRWGRDLCAATGEWTAGQVWLHIHVVYASRWCRQYVEWSMVEMDHDMHFHHEYITFTDHVSLQSVLEDELR